MIVAYIWFYNGISRAAAEKLEKEDYLEHKAFTKLPSKEKVKLFKEARVLVEEKQKEQEINYRKRQEESKKKAIEETKDETLGSTWERYQRIQAERMRQAIRIYYGIEQPEYIDNSLSLSL